MQKSDEHSKTTMINILEQCDSVQKTKSAR